MSAETKKYDCSRGCETKRSENGALQINYNVGCCKLGVFDWLEGIPADQYKDLYEVRFKNTRKIIFRNTSGAMLKKGDIVVVEAVTGHDVGIVTLEGPIVYRQLLRHRINPETTEFRRIYRKANILDIEKWQEAIAREHATMIRSRQIAARLDLDMKIGDVEFQGDGTKAIFYYIADERVDFRQLIKDFAEEFHIRIEMKQIGARQEAGLIGGIGVCGRPLCCSKYMSDFQSITTQVARCQDLSLNPQKLAGQCSKLKCCINYEASVYIDAHKKLPNVREALEFQDGPAFLVKTDVLKGIMWFSYEKNSMVNMFPLTADQVREVQALNREGTRPESLAGRQDAAKENEFISAVGDDSISRFDESKKKRKKNRKGRERGAAEAEAPKEVAAQPIEKDQAEGAARQKDGKPREKRQNEGRQRERGNDRRVHDRQERNEPQERNDAGRRGAADQEPREGQRQGQRRDRDRGRGKKGHQQAQPSQSQAQQAAESKQE